MSRPPLACQLARLDFSNADSKYSPRETTSGATLSDSDAETLRQVRNRAAAFVFVVLNHTVSERQEGKHPNTGRFRSNRREYDRATL